MLAVNRLKCQSRKISLHNKLLEHLNDVLKTVCVIKMNECKCESYRKLFEQKFFFSFFVFYQSTLLAVLIKKWGTKNKLNK